MLNTIFGSFSEGIAPSTTAYESISTVTVGSGGAANVEFTSIPATYTHLQIRGISRDASGSVNVSVQVGNGSVDTGSNYSWHYLQGTGSTAAAGAGATQSSALLGTTINTANVFGAAVIDILDYGNSNKYKTFRSLSGWEDNSSGNLIFWSGNWRSTSVITNIKLTVTNGFTQYSQFALYGIKGA